MADQSTRNALLRLRRVTEIEAQRDLVDARVKVEHAREAAERARRKAAAADEELTAARASDPPRTAGRLAARERFLERLRKLAKDAHTRALEAGRAIADAESRLVKAQSAMEAALRAREATETREAALAVRADRQRARREESANDDRFRGRRSKK